ncbi:MAG: DNA alkylation repair protein [Nitrospirae bacterium]|nr:DNA alkylation repair protein [Nitrospirota bacterium]MBF0540664.1 DNA alkylation repair protein [Nitrospirota bacterium]
MEDTFKINNSIKNLQAIFNDNADETKAGFVKSYLKSPYKFYGVNIPLIDKTAREFTKANIGLQGHQVIELSKQLWDSQYHEEKTLALRLLRYFNIKDIELYERLLIESKGWDHVDDISIYLVGALIIESNEYLDYLRKWSISENFWIRRASLISQILPFRKGLGDRALFYSFADKMIEEKEFFIRKAIGWTLRELSKIYPEEVYNYLIKVKDKASGLTLREGSKRLPEKYKFL